MASDFPINEMTKELFEPQNYLRHKMSILRRTFCFSLVTALLLITAHRLPAPIQESPESATPARAEQAKPRKAQSKSKAVESEVRSRSAQKPSAMPAPQGPARFAGTWTGHIDLRNPTTGGDQICTV